MSTGEDLVDINECVPEETRYTHEIDKLKEIIDEKTKEISTLETKLEVSDKKSKEEIEKLHVGFQHKLDEAFKKFQDSQKDKSSLVMKYADAEKRCIDLNRAIELLQSKLSDATKEKFKLEEIIGKVKLEKSKLNDELEAKLVEIRQLLLKIDKLKEDVVLLSAKNNVAQLKLNQEVDLNTKLHEEIERFRKIESENEQNLNSDVNKSKDLLEEIVRSKENLMLVDEERLKLTRKLNDQQEMNKNLLTEVLQLKEHQMTLSKEVEEKRNLRIEIDRLNEELEETQSELNVLRDKQNKFLEKTSKLTEKNIQLQSENSMLSEINQNLSAKLSEAQNLLDKSDDRIQTTIKSLDEKLKEQMEQNIQLKFKLNDSLKQVDELTTRLNDEHDEITSLKKKQAANIKDLTKQLQKLHKQAGKQVIDLANSSSSTTTNHTLSRTNSMASLDNKEIDLRSTNESISSSEQHQHREDITMMHQQSNDVYIVDVDKQRIIEKYVKLQKNLAKKNEKIDFFQDHINHLTEDLQRKTKIIQAFAMKQEVGAFTSEAHDANKIEIARKKGQITNDHSHMICQEINNKLQCLLEDTLIKNITLKDSLETLGQEIARLSQENRRIKIKIQE